MAEDDTLGAAVARPSARAELATAASGAATALLLAALAWIPADASAVALATLVATANLTMASGLVAWLRRRPRERRIARRGDTLTLDGAEALDLRDLRDVELHDFLSDGARLRLVDTGDRVVLEVHASSGGEAQQLITGLRLHRWNRTESLGASLRVGAFSRTAQRALAVAGVAVAGAGVAAQPAISVSLLGGIAALWLVGAVEQPAIAIAPDGLRFRKWPGRARFVPFAQIAAVEQEGLAVSLRLADGARRELLSGRGSGDGAHEEHVARVVRELRRALDAAHARARAPEALAALLTRGERTERAWLGDVRALARGADYRTAAPTHHALQVVLEDPSAEPSARVGAAIALRAVDRSTDLTDEALRDAAARVAHPQVRVALEAIAEGDDDAIAETLRALPR